ncbi:MAG TPA: hypothetical protein VHL08_03210 [Dongiaceae bacterium]|nr:hypothetical protein [Dongiaceae bacterium]
MPARPLNPAHLDEAREILRESAGPLTLLGPARALGIYGIPWFMALDKMLRKEFPHYDGMVLDAAERADHAHEALSGGLGPVLFSGNRRAGESLREIASKMGTVLILLA